MKSTGIIRKIDELGRVVIPIELRRARGLTVGSSLEICTDDEIIGLRKYRASQDIVPAIDALDRQAQELFEGSDSLSAIRSLLHELRELVGAAEVP